MEGPSAVNKGIGTHDVEAGTSNMGGSGGGGELYPSMAESHAFRWAFIRKVYCIITIQFVFTVAVAAIVSFIPSVSHYFVSTVPGFAIYITIVIFTFIIICPLFSYRKKHPVNFILLALFTFAIGFSIGMTCAFVKVKVILEALILTTVVVISLTVYTFLAVRRGHDFTFLGPFLFAGIMVLIFFSLIQIFFPLGKLPMMVVGLVAALLFSAYIVYDTNNLIKRYTYDEYIAAAVSLYLDIVNVFLAFLTIFKQC